MRLFFDTNVLLDVLANREPWADTSAEALSLVAEGKADGYVAAHTVTTLDYLLRKHLGAERAAAALVDLLGLVRVVAVDHDVLLRAYALGWNDFEDAVQAICALGIEADCIVTRDPKPFFALSVAAATPTELLAFPRR